MKLIQKLFPKSHPALITGGTIIILVILFQIGVPFIDLIELKTLDLRFQIRGAQEPSPAIALALIDEKSLDREGRWPWPRSKIASLIEKLSSDGAKVIAFDIGFMEPDEHSRSKLIKELESRIEATDSELNAYIREQKKVLDHDQALARAISTASADVVLGYFFHMSSEDLDIHLDPEDIEERLQLISQSKYPSILYSAGGLDTNPFIQAYVPESNLPALTSAADSSGYFTVTADTDGVVRWMPQAIQCGQDVYSPLAVRSAWHYLDEPQLSVRVASHGVEGIQLGSRFIPTDENGQMLLNYLGPPKTFPWYSITDILRGEFTQGTFTDKIVLIGSRAMGVALDLRSTPYSPVCPGVSIHATALDNILTQNFLQKPQWSRIFDILAIVLLGAATGVAIPRMTAVQGLIFGAGLIIGYAVFTHWLFAHSRIWLNLVYPVLAVSANHTYLTVYQYVTEERERKKIRNAFSQYTAPQVIEDVLKDPDRLKLGGEEKVLTVMFSDIEGFTSYSEKYPPTEMIDILSEFFESMTRDIFIQRGTLADYIGDELMAIFGAPLRQDDHAQRACAAALAMRSHLSELRQEWARKGRPLLRARTGINSGPMLVGNLGSKYRFAYGVLGDQVNLASRLEGLNKVYKTDIVMGENTAELVRSSFVLRELDWVRAKGRHQCISIFELVSESGDHILKEREKALGLYAQGLEAYRGQEWGQALELFAQASQWWPEDGPSQVMAGRCRLYTQSPPSPGWDCVFEQTVK